MNYRELSSITLRQANRELRAALKRALADVKYLQALLKLQEKGKK
jgi:hypothetical protein